MEEFPVPRKRTNPIRIKDALDILEPYYARCRTRCSGKIKSHSHRFISSILFQQKTSRVHLQLIPFPYHVLQQWEMNPLLSIHPP